MLADLTIYPFILYCQSKWQKHTPYNHPHVLSNWSARTAVRGEAVHGGHVGIHLLMIVR